MAYIKQVYKQSFIEKMETLLPYNYKINQYYQNPYNSNQYIMRNSSGYFHIIEIVKNKYGYTYNHFRINKNESIINTGERYGYYNTIEVVKNIIMEDENDV